MQRISIDAGDEPSLRIPRGPLHEAIEIVFELLYYQPLIETPDFS